MTIAAMVVIVIAAAVAAGIILTAQRPSTAQEAAAAYLRALESGDAAAVDATGIDVSDATLSAFSSATENLDEATVTDVRTGDAGEAVADVAFRLDGDRHTARLTLSRADGRWTVDAATALGTLMPSPSLGAFVAIGDERVPAAEDLALLPARYTVTAAPADLLEGESVVAVMPGDQVEATIDVALRPEATDAAQRRLDEHLAACTEPAAAPPARCGIRIPWGTEFRAVGGIRYRVESLPAITLAPPTFSSGGGVLVATVTGTGQDGVPRTETYRTESWSVRGDVAFTADGVVLTPW
ncbi:hypothetical protein [Microbacterium sp. 179-I 3D3 NHS]|uniref:hypothetical protein n=1 Tax=Microbacterium sp. 179-I 3D3 NHS TaxID=3142382 RepID=UPI00399F5A62